MPSLSIMHKVCIIGATGYLGKYIYNKFDSEFSVFGTTSKPALGSELLLLDLEKPQDFNYNQVGSKDYIVFCSAISSPDICKKNFKYAHSVNVAGTEHAIRNFLLNGARVVFCSSDTVYGSRKYPVLESAFLKPVGEYGKMKSEIENKFIGHKNFKTIRLSYIFSAEDKFSRFVIDSIALKKTIDLFDPLNRNIVWRGDVIRGIKNLILEWDKYSFKAVNFGGPDLLSREQFVQAIFEGYKENTQIKLSDPPEAFFESRPRDICLNIDKFKALLQHGPKTINEAAMVEFFKD